MKGHTRRGHTARWIATVVALAGIWGAPVAARAGGIQSDAKPLIFILLDTSGSMEYSAEATLPDTLPTCHTSRQDGFDYEKSRWAVAVEVLTGSFNDYWCKLHSRPNADLEEDSWWLEQHGAPRGVEVAGEEQNPDGLLDLYRDSVKFGLMTFDANPLTMTNASGGFSYGDDQTFTNLGARNESASFGAMVVPDADDDATSVQDNNDLVQAQILATRPYWTTPIGPMLDDALTLFQEDDRVKDFDPGPDQGNGGGNDSGDPYSDCRSRAVILVADGEPSVAYWSAFYPTPLEAALALYSAGIKVYVVGFQATSDALVALDAIAQAGGTEGVYVADNQAELTASLGEILVDLRGNRPARARSVFTNRTLNYDDQQYQFFGSFSPATSPLDEEGHLDQYVYRCEEACKPASWEAGDGASLCEIFSIDDHLDARTTPRRIYTQLQGVLQEVLATNNELTPDHLGVPDSGTVSRLDPLVLGSGQKVYSGITLGDASQSLVRTEYYEQLIRLLRADAGSRREDARLGAIVHSDPVIQADLFTMNVPVTSFNTYRSLEGVVDRPTVLFVQTHEGLLHAFRVDRADPAVSGSDIGIDPADYGEELWAFVPKHLLAKAHSLAGGMQYLGDGDPIVKEVRLYKAQSEIGAELADIDLEAEAERWRSIVVTGYGEGGRGYHALDVTRPEEFEFMWEISNTELCYQLDGGTAECDTVTDYARLGTSKSAAAIGTAFFTWKGTVQERAVAIFGGGGEVSGEADAGKAIYVVDLATGAVIREFCNDNAACGDSIIDNSTSPSNTPGFDCPVEGDVVAFDDTPGSTLTRAFVGDACGQLWRIDLTNPDPAAWTVEMFYDAFSERALNALWLTRRRPLKVRPALAVSHKRGELVIIAGSGDPEKPGTQFLEDRVFSLTESWDTTDEEYQAQENWVLELEEGERYTGEPIVFDKVAYFTTLAASALGSCAIGEGRLWGVHYTGYEDGATDDLEPMLDINDDPELITLARYQGFEGAELYGLQLVQRAACVDSSLNYAPWLGGSASGAEVPAGGTPNAYGSGQGASFTGSSGGALELVVQTGDLGASDSNMQAPSGGGSTGTGTKKITGIAAPTQSVFSASWGLLFD
jgi:type IV pilus assembly protein PilY1